MRYENKKRLLIALGLLLILFALHKSGIKNYFTAASFNQHKEVIHNVIQNDYWFAVLTFILLYIAVVAVTLPVTLFLNVVGGYLFGTVPALVYAVIGATSGALITFFAARYLLSGMLRASYGPAVEKFNAAFKEQGAYYLLFLQLFPLTPFAVINILAGLSGISPLTLFWTTAIGIIPGTAIYTFAGDQLTVMKTFSDVMSPKMLLALSMLAFASLIPLILRRLGWTK